MKIIIHSYNTQHVEPSVTATIYAGSCSTLMAGLWVGYLREEIPQSQNETSILEEKGKNYVFFENFQLNTIPLFLKSALAFP